MRHLVLALLIVLLPLRGWAGDAMATQMAGAAIATESGAASAHEIKATASLDHSKEVFEEVRAIPDCHEQMSHHTDADKGADKRADKGADKSASSEHCGTYQVSQVCQACQACHTVALSSSPLLVAVSFTSPQLRPAHAAAFTSAAAALGQKPPIS